MISIVIVSHSAKLAEGVRDLAYEMADDSVKIAAAGGLDDDTIGTNAERIYSALTDVYTEDGVLVLVDLGSAVMSTEMAIEMLPEHQQANVLISNAPLVEGAVVSGVEALSGKTLQKVNEAAEKAREMTKVRR